MGIEKSGGWQSTTKNTERETLVKESHREKDSGWVGKIKKLQLLPLIIDTYIINNKYKTKENWENWKPSPKRSEPSKQQNNQDPNYQNTNNSTEIMLRNDTSYEQNKRAI